MSENPLVTIDWLATHLDDPNIRLVDIRGRVLPATEPPPHYHSHRADYDTAHIPGAVFVDWTTDIVEPGSPSYDVANPERFAALMARLGIDETTRVIAYDDAGGMFAARLWWAMRYYGHQAVAVLDGGWQKWVEAGYPTTADQPTITPTIFTVHIQADLHSDAESIAKRAADTLLMDVRSPAEFAGEASRAARKGRIPDAVNLPRKRLLQADGTLRPIAELQGLFQEAGIGPDAPEIIVYCNSGVSASFGLLALNAAGYVNGRVYDGSWKDWGNSDRPIA